MVLVIVFIALLVLVGLPAWIMLSTRQSSEDPHSERASVGEITTIVSELKARGQNGNFVVFMFDTPDNNDELLPNVQYSIENGKLGFDWVLLAPENIKDQERIEQWIRNSGFAISKRTMNGVSYLRSEDEGIETLGAKIICEFYKLSPGTRLEIIREGF